MRFGSEVLLHRGGVGQWQGPARVGMGRFVRGRLLGARGVEIWVQLLQDDPWARVPPWHAGECGWFCRSALVVDRGGDDGA